MLYSLDTLAPNREGGEAVLRQIGAAGLGLRIIETDVSADTAQARHCFWVAGGFRPRRASLAPRNGNPAYGRPGSGQRVEALSRS